MKAFSSEQLRELNSQSLSGRFVEAAIFTRDQEDPTSKEYFVTNGRPISFNGHIYNPLGMSWSGIKATSSMELPSIQVVVPNLGGAIIDYIEENDIDIEGNDCMLQILLIDKFNKVTLVDEMLFQVEVLVADYHQSATFHLGVNWSLNDTIPRHTLEKQEFPGIRDDVIRVGT